MSEYEVTKLSEWNGPGQRPETGPMQFGNDWPGIFIRGDNALLGYALPLEQALRCLGKDDWLIASQLRGLLELLRSCSV